MRDIKFRAWDTKKSKWIGFNDIKFGANGASAVVYYDPERGNVVQAGLFELMQYTGLQDKNGVEIYEGDIVLGSLVVRWYDKDAKFMLYFNDKRPTVELLAAKYSEVIGNIYENPELVK